MSMTFTDETRRVATHRRILHPHPRLIRAPLACSHDMAGTA